MDIPAPGVGAVCGSCPEGYTGDASKCYGAPYPPIYITVIILLAN